MIAAEVERFEHEQRTRGAAPTIRRLRDEAEHARQHTLERARRMLAAGRSTDEVLEFLSHTLTNRLIHAPSQRLRDAAETATTRSSARSPNIYRLDQPHSMKDSIRRRLETTRRAVRGSGRAARRPGRRSAARASSASCRWSTRGSSRWPRASASTGASRASWPPPRRWPTAATPRCARWPRTRCANSTARLERRGAASCTRLLVPKDDRDDSNIFLEVRAGTGGDEAAIFAGDLFRMYARYAERRGWQVEILSARARRARRLQGSHQPRRRPAAPTRGSSSSPAPTACSACRPPRRRAASTPRPAPSRSCPKLDEVDDVDAQPGRPAHRHLPRLRRRRPARQQDRLGDPHHAPADRHRRRVPGRALAAQEPLARDVAAAARAARGANGRSRPAQQAQRAQAAGRQRRPLRAHPHLQLPAGPRHRPPHQPDALQARRRSWTASSTT